MYGSKSPLARISGDPDAEMKVLFKSGPRAVIPRSEIKFDARNMFTEVAKHLYK